MKQQNFAGTLLFSIESFRHKQFLMCSNNIKIPVKFYLDIWHGMEMSSIICFNCYEYINIRCLSFIWAILFDRATLAVCYNGDKITLELSECWLHLYPEK